MLNYRELPEEASSLVVSLAVIFAESGASIPLFPSPNLTVLKHPCALTAEQKPNVTNAKLINRTPAAWASQWHAMPRRKYSALYVSIVTITLWCQWDMPLLVLSSALLILFTKLLLSKKLLWLISAPWLLGLPCAVRSERRLELPHEWIVLMQHADLFGTLSDENQLIISFTGNVRLLSVKSLHLLSLFVKQSSLSLIVNLSYNKVIFMKLKRSRLQMRQTLLSS